MSAPDNTPRGSQTLAWVVIAIVLTGAAVGGYLLGKGQAPDQAEFASVRTESFRESFPAAFATSRRHAQKRGERKGRLAGLRRGEQAGHRTGGKEGDADADTELGRLEAEREAAEAAAAEAAELAIPAPCRGLPDSTARRMCIGAVEAGTYP